MADFFFKHCLNRYLLLPCLTSVLQRWGYTHGPHRAHKRIQLFRFTWVNFIPESNLIKSEPK